MNYQILSGVIELIEVFDKLQDGKYSNDLEGFSHWMQDEIVQQDADIKEPNWEGKDRGRSPESVISTMLVHMNRYAKTYSKSAMYGSGFTTQDEFIYLINLKAFGAMSKMELIKKNVQDKPGGIQIINRLIRNGWVEQFDSDTDKRSKVITITPKGELELEQQMHKIRRATQIVAGNLNYNEKMELISLLHKLNDFHQPIFSQNSSSETLLDNVWNDYPFLKTTFG
jgi:DNA-binding MarR family transcriptional regulator